MAVAIAAMGVAWHPDGQAAGSHGITVSAWVLSTHNCTFNLPSSSPSFSLDPSSGGSFTTNITFTYKCTGALGSTATFAFANNSGLYGSSPTSLRMRHSTDTTEFLSYSLSYQTNQTALANLTQTLSVSVSIPPAQFQNALAGTYSDTVQISVVP